MRAWGLAKGLQENGLDVTVAINESFPQGLPAHEDINLVNWAQDSNLIQLINSFDTVIMSYCMGDPSVFIAENIHDDVQLILDVYVPIYVEVSARDTDDMPAEYAAYQQDIARHNRVLQRGDYFICANEVQKIFYTGVLGSLGIVNPLSYRQDRIKIVPFGIHDTMVKPSHNPYKELGIKKGDKTVLWFGGLYPWFRIEELLEAVKDLAQNDPTFKFVIVGGKNPFNNNPDLLRQYEIAQSFAKKNKLLDKSIYFVDWVEYEERIDWYGYADFVISINQPGDENAFAWRTRVMDYIWGELVSLTNGGDPLGDELLKNKAAIFLPELKASVIVKTIKSIYKDKDVIHDARNALSSIRPKYFWGNVTLQLKEIVGNHDVPSIAERLFTDKNDIDTNSQVAPTTPKDQSRLAKAVKNPRKVVAYAKKKGIRRSLLLGKDIIRGQVQKRTSKSGRFVFIAHPMDNTGAPLVLLQIIDEVIEKYGARRVRLITPYIDKKIRARLIKKGIRIEKAAQMGFHLTAAQLALQKNDFVFMNTVAVYDNYRDVAINMLAHDRIKKLHWFIHEDEQQLRVVMPVLESKQQVSKIGKLARSNKLQIYVPSLRVKKFYDELFETDTVENIPLLVDVPDEYRGAKTADHYKKLAFYISGTPSDGRKGQLIALAAFQEFALKYYAPNPENYRDFSLHLVAIGNDYISQQIKSIGTSTLGERLHVYPSLPRHEALGVANDCNVSICCSLNETFALYIAEGMLMGHIILRNDTAGVDEQLKDGKNGYLITDDIPQFAYAIEHLLNKKTNTDDDLQAMGEVSQTIMKPYADNKYLPFFKDME